jgi:universal stress protein A
MLDAFYERGLTPTESVKRITQKARKRIKEIVEIAATSGVKIPVRIHFKEGDAPEHILQQVETLKADLIVMGTHGRRGATRFFLGSVAETVIRRAPCPVLTLRS